jgi:magnesium transporter
MNVPYPGFSHEAGFAASIAVMIISGVILYVVFRRRDWL